MKDKRILVICKEKYSYPMYFLIKEMMNYNTIAIFFTHPAESVYDECLYNTYTYYKMKRDFSELKIYDMREISNVMLNKSYDQVDIEYLKYVEEEYTTFKNLNMQVMSDQAFSAYYHKRPYYNHFTEKEKMKWIELNYKYISEVLQDFNPDCIFDNNDETFQRTVLNEIAYKKNIPYINMDYPRFDMYKTTTYNMGVERDRYFEKEYLRCINGNLKEEYDYIKNFRDKERIMSKEYENTITSTYVNEKWLQSLYVSLIYWKLYFQIIKNKNNKKLLRKKSFLLCDEKKHIKFAVDAIWEKRKLMKNNKYFEQPDPNDKYILMPLHLIPESTTFVRAPLFVDEINIIEQISKSLPLGYKLYVKEHQAMVGERREDFYKQIKKLTNVKLVQFNYYNDPKPWISKSCGVITITGTAAYEAALLGKKSIIFGTVPYDLISSVKHVNSFEEMEREIKSMCCSGEEDNIKSCAAYIKTVKNIGHELNLHYLLSECELVVRGKKEYSEKLKIELDKYYQFYCDSFEKYERRKND